MSVLSQRELPEFDQLEVNEIINEANLQDYGLELERSGLVDGIEEISSREDNFLKKTTPNDPGIRVGTTFDTAKRWLTSWLRDRQLLYCPVTFAPMEPGRAIDIAHIMLPPSASEHAVNMVASVFGMRQTEMSIHSRLFLMPLRKDIHALIDCQKLLLIPSAEDFLDMARYLDSIPLNYVADVVAPNVPSPWSAIRTGTTADLGTGFERIAERDLTHLKEGRLHSYRFLASPLHTHRLPAINTQPEYSESHPIDIVFRAPYTDFPLVTTHVTPFAMALRLLHALEYPNTPLVFDDNFLHYRRGVDDFARLSTFFIQALLPADRNGVRQATITPQIREHAAAFDQWVRAFQTRCLASERFWTPQVLTSGAGGTSGQRTPSLISSHSSASDSRRGSMSSKMRVLSSALAQQSLASPTPSRTSTSKRRKLAVTSKAEQEESNAMLSSQEYLSSGYPKESALPTATALDTTQAQYLTTPAAASNQSVPNPAQPKAPLLRRVFGARMSRMPGIFGNRRSSVAV